MSRVWKIAVPLAVVIVVGGYAVGSLAASDLDDVTPRQPIVIGDDADSRHGAGTGTGTGDRRERPDQKDDQRGDDRRTEVDDDDDDVAVVRPDVDDLDDDDGDDGPDD